MYHETEANVFISVKLCYEVTKWDDGWGMLFNLSEGAETHRKGSGYEADHWSKNLRGKQKTNTNFLISLNV